MSFAYLVSLLLLGSIAFAPAREMKKASPRPAGLRGHIRARGWGLLLLPVALMAAVMTGHVHALAVVELAIAGALVTWAPRLAAKLVPYALLALALFGLILAKDYHEGFNSQVQYGLVLAGAGSGEIGREPVGRCKPPIGKIPGSRGAGEHGNMKLGGRRNCTVPQRRGTEIDPKRDRVTADAHLLPREIDLVGPSRLGPVDDTSLDAAGDQEPIPSIAARDYQQRCKDN